MENGQINIPKTPAYITLNHKDDSTCLSVSGIYDIVAFFPNGESSNLCIVLKEREEKENVK